ncbi:hypothetical protein F2Q69_00028946 [Brassica cretica]|uniref:NYN domain-containing protein n=1 Tax=Brassica cretica TaxID=69181 RepID=A0A8S9S8B0_BRACR|nr:hypothetical protein F2Q69_00028946 [Brassica cretica]
MGEFKIEDFSTPITTVKGAKTGVFWDLDDCPFPKDLTPDVIHKCMDEALTDICRVGDKLSINDRMFHDILLWSMDSPVDYPDPANLIVVSDKVRDHRDFFETLRTLDQRHYGVMLVTPAASNLAQCPDWPAPLLNEDAYCFGYESESEDTSLQKPILQETL